MLTVHPRICIELAMPFELPQVSIAAWIASRNGTALDNQQQCITLINAFGVELI